MAIYLDDRYILLLERPLRWLDRAYDGWDLESDRAITAGFFESPENLPVLPGTLHLRHSNILSLIDLRRDTEGDLWAIWDHMGVAGADQIAEHAIPFQAALWVTHEAASGLLHARSIPNRPGGFRLADFGADQIRLFDDGVVKVTGFGRIGQEREDATEFESLGLWATEWLVQSGAEGGSADDTLSADLVASLTRFGQADANPQARVPGLIPGLRSGMSEGDSALARWVGSIESPFSPQALNTLMKQISSAPASADEKLTTERVVSKSDGESAAQAPRVTIAPRIITPVAAPAEKTHKGLPIRSSAASPAVLIGVALLLILFGSWRYGGAFSWLGDAGESQVMLETVPAGASVFLNDTLLAGKTPLPLNDLGIGWNYVRFEKSEFPPIDDSILVYKPSPHRPHRFVFTRAIRVESLPPGAGVYLNGVRASARTPYLERSWPVTDPLSVVMHLEQFGSIEDCTLDPLFGTVEVKDPAAWTVTMDRDTLVVRGMFVHSVSFFASPPDCRLVIDDTLVVDPTGGQLYPLTFGRHRVRAQAIGFDALDTTIVVGGQTEQVIPLLLSRPVRIGAYDPERPDVDLRVLVDRLEGPDRTLYVRRFTPYTIRIPAVAYAVTLRKRNYRDTTIFIPPDLTTVAVAMTPTGGESRPRISFESIPEAADPGLTIEPRRTTDRSMAGAPWVQIQVSAPGRGVLAGAEIWARSVGDLYEIFLGTTDARGRLKTKLPAGNYDLLAYLDSYSGVRKRVKVRTSRNRPIVIDLNP